MNAADIIALHARVFIACSCSDSLRASRIWASSISGLRAASRDAARARARRVGGLAGQQTGVYPAAAPGGWQLIGRTPVRPFRLDMPSPFLFSPGDAVEFVPIGRDGYIDWSGWRAFEEITSTAESNERAEKKSVHQSVPDRPAR